MQHWKALVFFLTVTLLYCREAFLSGQLLFTPESDWINSVYSSMAYFQYWSRQGIFPLWNTLSMCGHTFGLNSISYPSLYHLLSVFLDLGIVYNLVIMMSLFLNGVFLYLFLARKGLSRYAAFAGGLIWMLSKPYAVDTGFFSLPLCFFLADRYLTQKSRLNFALFTLAISFYSLNANPQYFLYGALMLFFYVIFCELKLSLLSNAKVTEYPSRCSDPPSVGGGPRRRSKDIPLLLRYSISPRNQVP